MTDSVLHTAMMADLDRRIAFSRALGAETALSLQEMRADPEIQRQKAEREASWQATLAFDCECAKGLPAGRAHGGERCGASYGANSAGRTL